MNTQMMHQRTKRLALAAAMAAALIGSPALAPSGNAQGQSNSGEPAQSQDPSQMMERRVAMLTSHLQLQSQQITQVREILNREHEQLLALRDEASNQSRIDRTGPGPRGSRSVPPPEVRAIRDRTEREIEKILTPQQVVTYRALKESRKLPSYTRPASSAASPLRPSRVSSLKAVA